MHHIHTIHGSFGSSSALSSPNGPLFGNTGSSSRTRTQSMFLPSTHVTKSAQQSASSPRCRQSSVTYGIDGNDRKVGQHRPSASNSFSDFGATSSNHGSSKQRIPQRTSMSAPKPFIRPLSAAGGIAKSSPHRASVITRPEYSVSIGNASPARRSSMPPTYLTVRDSQEGQPFKFRDALHWDTPHTHVVPERPLVISIVPFPQAGEDIKSDPNHTVTRPPSSSSLSSIASTSSVSSVESVTSREESNARRAQAEKERRLHWHYLAQILLNRAYSRTSSLTRSRRENSAIFDTAQSKFGSVRGAKLCETDKLSDEAVEEEDFSVVLNGRDKALGKHVKPYVKSGLSRVIVFTVDT